MTQTHLADVLARNAVRVVGTGPPMVLMHGFGCDQTMWNRLAPRFVDDHQVIQYDLTGMGMSDYQSYDRRRHGRLEGHADDLVEGHSVSATIAALAAIRRPDLFSALVMVGLSPSYIDRPPYKGGFSEADIEGLLQTLDENYVGWAGHLASMVAGQQESDEVEQQLNSRFCRNDPEITRHFARVTFLADNRDDLPKIQTPTLVIQSARAAIADPEYVHANIPDSRLVHIDSTGHAPHMMHPDEVAVAIRRFLAEL